jgi:aryl-alcohol dehydrogenase-like predicted oxidoreductase
MEYTQLGRTGLKVSRLVLGTMNFGPQTDEADSHAIMDAALDAGINFFDTANVYGWGENKGRTEEIIGNWFAKGGDRRDKTVIATKVYGNMGADGEAWPNHDKLSAVNIRRAVDASLKRLRTDRIDLYQFHHIDRATGFDEIWQAIDTLVQQGKVLYAGSSNFPGYKIAQANETAARRGGTIGLVSEQCLYNLAERRAEMEVIPAAQDYGLGVIPWSPLHGGLLGGVIKKEVQGGRRASGRAADTLADPAKRAQIQAYEDLLDKHGVEPGEAALAWLLTRPGVTGPIVGPRTAEQLASALRAVELELSDELLAGLDEIFPGPGPSPEACAWEPGGQRGDVVSGGGRPRPGQPRAAATATTTSISTSTPAMIRLRVFGSTAPSLTGRAERAAGDRLVTGLLARHSGPRQVAAHQREVGHGPGRGGEAVQGLDVRPHVVGLPAAGQRQVGPVAPVLAHLDARLAPRRLRAVGEQPQRRQVTVRARPQGPPVPELPAAAQRQREGRGAVGGPLQAGREVRYEVVVDLAVEGEGEVPPGAPGPAQPLRAGQLLQRGHLGGEGGGDVLGGQYGGEESHALTLSDPYHRAPYAAGASSSRRSRGTKRTCGCPRCQPTDRRRLPTRARTRPMTSAAVAATAPPAAKPARAPYASVTQPTIGAPTGEPPRKTIM